jgi:Uri superfamily endonuclease
MAKIVCSASPDDLPRLPGTYAVLLRLERASRVQVGRLGTFDFPAGWYVYLGSARGAGGLKARVRHHWQATARPRWHMDYLRGVAQPVQVAWKLGRARRECQWSSRVSEWEGAGWVAYKFGSSDCDCPTHLWHFPDCPDLARLETSWPPDQSTRNWDSSSTNLGLDFDQGQVA